VLGFYAYIAPYILLFAVIYAMILGAGILSKEEDEKTIEFLLAKPVTRNRIVAPKMLATAFYILLFNIINTIANLIMIEAVRGGSKYDLSTFLLISAGFALAMLTFAAAGFIISIFVVKSKSILSIALGVVLGEYFLSIASGVTKDLDVLKHVTVFKYVDPTIILRDNAIKPAYIAVMLCVTAVSVLLTFVLYNKKDINV
jgi:ABC-2 type transport system permease protein